MPIDHVVKEGETLLAILKPYGFGHLDAVLNHGPNRELAQRKHPNMLIPGETVVIPDAEPFAMTKPTGSFHRIELKALVTKLRVKLRAFDSKPLAAQEVKLSLDGAPAIAVSLDGDGAFEQEVPPSIEMVEIRATFDDPLVPPLVWTLKIGDLGRAEQEPGALARLQNLGYYRDVQDKGHEFQSAVEEFQCDHGLEVTGKLNQDTVSKLVEIHGS